MLKPGVVLTLKAQRLRIALDWHLCTSTICSVLKF
jgi:hypothetical protein